MKVAIRFLAYGVAIWLIPFALGVALFPIVDQTSALFDTIMSLASSASAGPMSFLYLRGVSRPGALQGVLAGLGWAALAVGLDAPLFIFGPFRMATPDYVADIGLTYLMIPIIAGCVGLALSQRERRVDH